MQSTSTACHEPRTPGAARPVNGTAFLAPFLRQPRVLVRTGTGTGTGPYTGLSVACPQNSTVEGPAQRSQALITPHTSCKSTGRLLWARRSVPPQRPCHSASEMLSGRNKRQPLRGMAHGVLRTWLEAAIYAYRSGKFRVEFAAFFSPEHASEYYTPSMQGMDVGTSPYHYRQSSC